MFQFQIFNVGIGDVDRDPVYAAFTHLRSSCGKVLVARSPDAAKRNPG